MSARQLESEPRDGPHGFAAIEANSGAMRLAAFGLFLIPLWVFFHPYAGIIHDSILYTLCALARVTPSLASDVFLRYGSQDHFTLFGPLYASLIRRFGLESAAALLTLLSQGALFVAAYHLAKRWTSSSWALLSVAVLMVMPSNYGAFNVFNAIEEFATPRLPAEALTLAALTFCLARRWAWSATAFVGAIALHPIMASAGAGLAFVLYVALPRPKIACAIGASGLLLLTAIAVWAPVGPIAQFDNQWLQLVKDRSPFSFTQIWRFDHWARIALPLCTLALIGARTQNEIARQIGRAALLAGLAGIALTMLCSDWLHIVIVTQMQPWRWLWIANVISVLLIVPFAGESWRSGKMTRACLLLLVLAWMLRQDAMLSLECLVASSLVIALRNRISQERHRSWILIGCSAVFVFALALNAIENLNSSIAFDNDLVNPNFPELQFWASNGIWPLAVVALTWWATQYARPLAGAGVVSLISLVLIVLLAPSAMKSWSQRQYERSYAEYSAFRKLIPVDAEVLWPEEPLKAWYLLERPSYISLSQTAGVVFSRQNAIELKRRAEQAAPLLPAAEFDVWVTKSSLDVERTKKLREGCAASHDLQYVVATTDLGEPMLASVTLNPAFPNIKARLYSCAGLKD